MTGDFEDFFEHAPCGCVITDKDGRILRVNETLARWLNSPAASLQGRAFSRLLTVGGRIYYETHVAPLLRMHGKVEAIALDLAGEDRQALPILLNASEKRGADGSAATIRFTLFNASERRSYERNLLQLRAAAQAEVEEERSNAELREQFMAVLGHDLRNPVASIASGVHLLRREQLSERGRKVLDLMAGSVTRATTLIENVMDLARAGLGGGISIELQESDLTATIEQVIAEMRSIAPNRVIDAEVQLDVPISADRSRLGQLVSNLLGNALTHGDPDQPVTLKAKSEEGAFTLSVANGGEPIDPDTMKGLFKPFFRGTVRPSQQGLGLGLHITSEIAKAHGGTVEVSSNELLTTFTFTMPLTR